MTTPLWNKSGASVQADAMAFMSRDDVILDRELFLHDIRATAAHVRGLQSIDALSAEAAESIQSALETLAGEFRAGSFVLDERYEDGHSAIESYLTERLGDTGKRVHLGRSRNDQIAVALRLYMLDVLTQAQSACLDIAQTTLALARDHEMTPIPGYTHLQRAVPSTVGLWMASFTESFTEIAELCSFTRRWLNSCPLGTAAGYAVNLPLPRDQVSNDLGFDRVQINPMTAQAARGRYEHQVICVLWQAMQEVRRLSWDLSLYSSAEFGFITLGPGHSTGSSIMPNKRNPDMAELLRASTAVVAGSLAEIQQVLSLPSGYHRDLQLTKPPFIRAAKTTLQALAHIPALLSRATLDPIRMREAIDSGMLATDRAVELTTAGTPFRDAYRQIAESLENSDCDPSDIEASLAARVSLGGCANLGLDRLDARITQLREVSTAS